MLLLFDESIRKNGTALQEAERVGRSVVGKPL
jgi:hypothetical protein